MMINKTGDNDDDRQVCKPEGCWEV